MTRSVLYLLLVLGLAACSDPYEENITPAFEEYPVATMLEMDGGFTRWVQLLKYTGLFNTMNLSATYTCFVPDDAAMDQYLQKKGVASVTALTAGEALYLVKYHTIAGKIYSQSLFDNGVIPDTTATGDFLSIAIREGGLNAIFVNNEARISRLDIEATNGIIHVIEEVLTPVTQTIMGKMGQPGFAIMLDALKKTGYSEMLNTTTVAETNPLTGETLHRKNYVTFFAVSDAVFNAGGILDLAGLLSLLQETGTDFSDPGNELNKYVAYHILPLQLDFATLASFQEGTASKNLATLAENQLINFSEQGDQLRINYDASSESFISVVESNISTKNGIIHIINGLMPVVTPPKTRVLWELTDFADMASVVSNIYRKSGVSATTTRFFEPGDISSCTWSAIPSSKNSNSVAYLIAHKNDATRYEMVNYDCLYLELGLYGWIEMKTPAIIKGEYTMKVSYYSLAASSRYGKFMLILDGEYVGAEIASHGVSTTKTQIVTTTVGKVSFNATASHKLRILAGDNSAVFIDHIVFEPIN